MVLGTASRHWRLGGLSFICASTLGPIGHHFSRQLLAPFSSSNCSILVGQQLPGPSLEEAAEPVEMLLRGA